MSVKPNRVEPGIYNPDNIRQDTANCAQLHNVFIKNDGSLFPVPQTRLAAPQPENDTLSALFASPTTNSNFNVFGGGEHLYVWSNIKSAWIMAYEAQTKAQFRWTITDFNGIIYAARDGEGLVYFDQASEAFLPVEGAPPMGAIYATADFLIGYRITDKPNYVYWSALKDGMKWEAGKDNSGFEIFTRGGSISAVIGGQNPFIFTLRQIYRMNRQGGDAAWAFKLIDTNTGAYTQQDCCEVNGDVYFDDTQSYFRLTQDEQLIDIGRDRVSRTWPYYQSEEKLASINMRAVADVMARRAYFVFPGRGTLIYNILADRWSTMEHEGLDVFIGNFHVSSYDQMDEVYASICLVPYRANDFRDSYACALALSRPDGIYLIDDNFPTQALIDSGLITSLPEQRDELNNVSALTDNNAVSNRVEYTRRASVAPLRTDFVNQNSTGLSNYRINGYRFRITSRLSGFEWFSGWEINQDRGF